MTRVQKLAILSVIAAAVALCGGCMKIGVEVAVAPDGSSTGRMVAGIDASFAEMGTSTGSPFSGLTDKPGNWKSREYKEGNWLMSEATGSAKPGEPLFPPDGEDSPALKVQTAVHRLSTRYTVRLQVPPIDPSMVKPEAGGEDAQFAGMAKAMMANFEVSFSLRGPGRLIASTGKAAGPGTAEWRFGIAELGDKKLPDFSVVTELPNCANLGRLADRLAYTGRMYDAAARLAAAQQRGLLPDPPVNTAAADKLQAEDYASLLEVIDHLDRAAKPAVTDSVIAKAGLNDDEVTAEAIAAAHARVLKADPTALVDSAAGARLLEVLKGK